MFGTRLASGIVLVIIALLTLSMGGPVLALLLLAISCIAYKELSQVLQGIQENTKCNMLEMVGFVGIVIYYIAVFFTEGTTFLLMSIVCVILAELFVYVLAFPKYNSTQLMAAVFSFVYAPVMLSFVYLTRMSSYGFYMVWLILICSWGNDTCAYLVGRKFGKHKIFPVLSPKKSLEGCIGGVVGAALIGGIYTLLFVENVVEDQTILWSIVFICAVGACMSIVGDLVASGIKRNHNVKDYGKLIPGHGGIMDRFDSMIVTAPMIYFLTVLMISAS